MRIRAAVLLALCAIIPVAAAAEYVEGEVIVIFKPAADAGKARRALDRKSLKFQKRFAGLSNKRGRETGLVRKEGSTTAELVEMFRADPDVESVEPNYLRRVKAVPNDANFTNLWALQNTGQSLNGTSGTAGSDMKFLAAWKMARPAAADVVVGVIDTGIDRHHPDLIGNLWTNPGEIPLNGIDDDGNGEIDDDHGANFADAFHEISDSGDHGTHVAGTVGATANNQIGVTGTNPRARIMALKVSTDGETISSAGVIQALQYAVMMKNSGVNLCALNGSYGGAGFSTAERNAIEDAGDAGIIFCAAAGNESANNDAVATYPANYRLPNMIVVASSDQNDGLSSFSNRGVTKVDLAAPGSNIYSTRPGTISVNLLVGATGYSAIAMTHSGTTAGITGNVVDCGIGSVGQFPPAVNGNVALIQRGTHTFEEKTARAMAAGATAAIIYNNVAGGFGGTLGNDANWIPAVSISQADGATIKAALPKTAALSATRSVTWQYLSGTSMATPQVAAAVSFAAMNFPAESVTQRVARILGGVDVKPALIGKTITGGRLNLLKTVDTDGNNLPDWWEDDHFNQSTGVDPAEDADGDGMSNLAEFLSGTDPGSSISSLRMVAASRTAEDGNFTLSWAAVPGKAYQVEYSSSLAEEEWFTDLPDSEITTPEGEFLSSYTDTTAGGETHRFYRVRVVD